LTDATQYEHRVGRTGRAGKDGEALLLLADDEARLLKEFREFPLKAAGTTGEYITKQNCIVMC
jgi:ATP-dependent RNA helicase MSS116